MFHLCLGAIGQLCAKTRLDHACYVQGQCDKEYPKVIVPTSPSQVPAVCNLFRNCLQNCTNTCCTVAHLCQDNFKPSAGLMSNASIYFDMMMSYDLHMMESRLLLLMSFPVKQVQIPASEQVHQANDSWCSSPARLSPRIQTDQSWFHLISLYHHGFNQNPTLAKSKISQRWLDRC